MADDKKVDLLFEENNRKVTLNPNSYEPQEFRRYSYGACFAAWDIELVSLIDCSAREWDTLPAKMVHTFSCRGSSTEGWSMGVIGDSFKTTDLIITISAKNPADTKHMAEWQKAEDAKDSVAPNSFGKNLFQVTDVIFGKQVADWEIPNSTTNFWISIDVTQEVLDGLVALYKEGNLQSLNFKTTFTVGKVYQSASAHHSPFIEPDTYYLLPHKEYGIRYPEIAYGKLDYFRTAGKRLDLKPMRNELEEYYDEKYKEEERIAEVKDRSEYAAPPADTPEQDMARQLGGIYSRMNDLNKTFKYILYTLIAIAIFSLLKY